MRGWNSVTLAVLVLRGCRMFGVKSVRTVPPDSEVVSGRACNHCASVVAGHTGHGLGLPAQECAPKECATNTFRGADAQPALGGTV